MFAPLALVPAAVIAALLAIIFILAWNTFGAALVHAISVDIPYVGNVLGDLVELALDGAYAIVAALMDYIVAPIENFIIRPIEAIQNPINALEYAVGQLASGMQSIVTGIIPAAVTALANLSGTIGSGASTLIFNDINETTGRFSLEIDAISGRVDSDFTSAESYAHALFEQAMATTAAVGLSAAEISNIADNVATSIVDASLSNINGLINTGVATATGYADTLAAGIEADIARAVATAEAFATTAIAGVKGIDTVDVDNVVAAAIGAIATELPAAVVGAIDTAGDWGADIIDGLRDIPLAKIGSLAGVAALAGATTLSFARYLEECGIPNCENLSQYGKDLQSLLGLVGDASFLALLVELIEHPGSASETFNDTFGGAVSAGESLTHQLLGI